VEVDIIGVNLDGDGVAEVDGRVVAVPLTIPGERVDLRLARGRDGKTFGEVLRILVASPHRVTPACRHFGPCGGCAWQHIAYAEQLRLKQRLVQDAMARVRQGLRRAVLPTRPTPPGASGAAAESPVGPATPWHYRNKVSFAFGPGVHGHGLVMGHYRRGSRAVVPVTECPVHAEAGNRFAFALHDVLERARIPGSTPDGDAGIARHVVARVTESGGGLLGTLVVTENVKPLRNVTAEMQKALRPEHGAGPAARSGFHLNVHDRPGPFLFGRETRKLFGVGEVREQVSGITYLVAPTAFFQTNVRAAEVLVREVLDAVPRSRPLRVLDLYSGVGLFALPLARDGRTVTAVEENRHAMAGAASAMRLNGISEQACRLVAARVEEAVDRLAAGWDVVILDPPRQGCPARVLKWLFNSSRPPRIVYVSCHPDALARDLEAAPSAGYRFERIQPIDMFPHTAHVETVAVLERD
jgi:23S rRNA (uracil1939-C5)-methyltransferase